IMSLIVYCLAFVLGVLGNGVVIWVTGFKMKKTVNTVWFLNLAVADFLFTVFLPLSITLTALDFHWPFGKFMCKLNTTISFLNLYASVYILVVISVDRCVSVVWPVWAQNHRNVRKASFVSLGVWVMALILSTPYFIFRDTALYNKDENDIECFNNFALSDDYENESVIQLRLFRHKAMTITNFLLGFVVPFTVIVSCYAVIIHHIKRNRTLASHSRRSFKIIAAVITAFFLCWAPYHIIDLLGLANSLLSDRSETLDHVTTIGIPITSSLAFLNSCLNPLLYVFMGQDFKDIYKDVVQVTYLLFSSSKLVAMGITRFLLGLVVPFTVIVSCYAVIIHHIRRNRTLASHSSRSFKIIAAVITTFFLCWAPFHIMVLIELANSLLSDRSETLDHVTTIGIPITSGLAFLNSCLNPLLYVFMGQDFKDKVRKSILNVLETAFTEEVSGTHSGTKSVDTSQSREMSSR
uniref:Formyl peptide receptor 1 n=1 Tax=Gasterosteus aculeatus TaxID=69293 RepID=G3NX62_GASAC